MPKHKDRLECRIYSVDKGKLPAIGQWSGQLLLSGNRYWYVGIARR